jgi:hypothetical protein
MRHRHSCSDRTAARAAPRWRAALDALIGAPVRLHRYRHLHAEVIEDALRAFDGGPQRENRK